LLEEPNCDEPEKATINGVEWECAPSPLGVQRVQLVQMVSTLVLNVFIVFIVIVFIVLMKRSALSLAKHGYIPPAIVGSDTGSSSSSSSAVVVTGDGVVDEILGQRTAPIGVNGPPVDTRKRLMQLRTLRDEGLISEDDFAENRKKIIEYF
jgi:hypothetical protein